MIQSFRRHVVLIGLLLAGTFTPSFADSSRRTLLATGDMVPGFGAVGGGGFDIKAVTNDGRLLVTAALSDGRQGLFFAAHRQLTPIWTSDQAPGATIDFYTATAHSAGAVAVAARVASSALPFFYVFTPAGESRVVHTTSPDPEGNALCYVDTYHAKVNGSGDIAFQAGIAPPGRTCDSFTDFEERPTAIYVTHANQLTRAFSSLDPTLGTPPDSIELVGLADDGAVIAMRHWRDSSGVGNPLDVVRVKSGVVDRIAGSGDGGPSGASLALLSAVVANAAGEIAFTALEVGQLGLYRTDGGLLIRVAWPLVSPSNAPYANFDKLTGFNAAGDIAFAADWYTSKADGSQDGGRGVVLYRAGEGVRGVFVASRDTGLGRYAAATGALALSEHGVIAFGVTAYDGDTASQALTWSDGTLGTALVSGDPGPDGTVIAAGGLNWYPNLRCLAPDGRVAAVASSTKGHEGVVCVDADGPHLVVQSGTIAPDGFAFTDFATCSFTDDGGLIFSGSRAVPDANGTLTSQASVYRAGVDGITRVYGDGDAVSNGTTIPDYGSGVSFVANAKGSVLALPGGAYNGLFLSHDGHLDLASAGNALQWALADTDDVVTISRLGDWSPPEWPRGDDAAGNAVLVWRDGRIRIVAFVESAPYATFGGFTNLSVRGDLVLYTRLGGPGQPDGVFFYRLGDSAPHEISAALARGGILDFTPAGRILQHLTGVYELLNPDGTNGILVPDTPEVTPFGVSDRGNVALYAYANPPGSQRQTIELVGPAADSAARCPLPLTPPMTTPHSDTPTPTPTATPMHDVGSYRAYVSQGATDTVAVIDTATQELLATVRVSHYPTALAASADGTRIFVVADNTVNVIDAASLQVIRSIPLGDGAVSIFIPPGSQTPFVTTWTGGTGQSRLVLIDSDANLVRTVLLSRGRVFGLNPNDGRWLATSTTGDPCNSHSDLLEIDAASADIVNHVGAGRAATSAVVSADGTVAYIADGCSDELSIVDLSTFAVVRTVPVGSSAELAVTADGGRAYTTHSYSSYSNSPDGSHTTPQGYLSAVDLAAGTSEQFSIAGGRTEHVTLSPDGRLAYVTIPSGATGSVAVIDTETNTQIAALLPAAGANGVVVAPVPGTPAVSPTPQRPQVVIRADSVIGVVGDAVPVAVRLDSQGLDVGSVEHELVTTWHSPLYASQSNLPECQLAPDVDAVATFEFDRFCRGSCDRVHVTIRAATPGAALPHNGILYTCTVYLADFQLHPILISSAIAADPTGQSLPVFGADSQVLVLSHDNATPRPTRTRPPTATATITPTLTPTPLPVMVEIGSGTVTAGSRVTIPVVLHTNGARVVGTQNDISFSGAAPIASGAVGKPDCAVNPAIAKPNTSFTFVPAGCDYGQRHCTAVRALVLSLEDLNSIPDQSVLYTCVVEPPLSAPLGTFSLRADAAYASDPNGQLLPAAGVDGSVSVSAPRVGEPSVTATATATNSPAPAATSTPVPTSTSNAGRVSGAAASQATTGGGCNVSPESNGSGGALAACVLVLVLVSRKSRRATAR